MRQAVMRLAVAGRGGTLPPMISLLADSQFNAYAAVGVLIIMAVIFGVVNVLGSTLLGPRRQTEVKGITYESGMNPIGDARRRFNVRFYIVAMTFLLFDVEIVFLYPWATTFPSLGGETGSALSPVFLLRMLFFVLTSVIAFVYPLRQA